MQKTSTHLQSATRLVLLGGAPRFASPQHVGRPNIAAREPLMARLNDVLDRRWLSNDGKYLQEFEHKLAEISNTRHAIVYSNATVAIEWLLRAMDLNGEIIVPAFTFVASAHAVLTADCTPVLADVDSKTHLIDIASIERLIGPKTVAIMGVHLWGQPANIDRLQALADKHHLKLVFDAAHALGATYNGRPIGSFGDAAVYSFHATKFVNSLEGGAIVTNQDALANRLKQVRNFGFRGYDNVEALGTNGKMDEFRAAVGIGSLESMDEFIAINRRNWLRYKEGLQGTPGIELYDYPIDECQNYQYVVLAVTEACPLRRNELLNVLWTENIQARRYFFPGLHNMEPYRGSTVHVRFPLPGTERASQQVLVLPTGQSMQAEDVDQVVDVIRSAIEHASEVRIALQQAKLPMHPTHPLELN